MCNAFDVTVEALRKQGLNSDEILGELSKLFQKFADFSIESAKEQSTVTKIQKILKKLGMPVQLKGYKYWVDAIEFYVENGGMLKIGEIYTMVAEKYEVSYTKVERNMRFAVEHAFDEYVDPEVAEAMFGKNKSSVTGKPRNRQFLIVLAEQI